MQPKPQTEQESLIRRQRAFFDLYLSLPLDVQARLEAYVHALHRVRAYHETAPSFQSGLGGTRRQWFPTRPTSGAFAGLHLVKGSRL